MRIIDAHTHVLPQYAELAVRVMDKTGVESSITLEWHDGFGQTLRDHLAIFQRYPGRFVVFGNVDFRRINEPDFAARAADQMEIDAETGMKGIKIYKALGLEYRQENGEFWRINDPRFDPIWAKAGTLHLPILMHTADPSFFWEPINDQNFWNGVLYGEYAWWSYYRKGFPSRDELLAERNDVIARHPDTIFICPHIGSKSESLDAAADDLDRLPNLFYDLSARVPILGLSGRHSERSREFFSRYQDRILFGSDAIYDDTNLPTGMQAQCLYQPGEIPLGDADPKERYIETSATFLRSHFDFLTTGRIQNNPPFKRNRQGYSITGLALDETVCAKIFHANVERLVCC